MLLVVTLGACGPGRREASPSPEAEPTPHPRAPRDVSPWTIVFLGTSLTAGLGVDPEEAYPALIQRRIDAEGLPYRVVNAGLSGETSAGALRRLDWLLRQGVDVLVVETGANDGLRGQDPEATRANIDAILSRAQSVRPAPRLVLMAMEAPPNYGPDYARRFRALYPELASEHGAVLLPFLLSGVAGVPALNQTDGIHPTAEGHRKVAENVWAALRPLLVASEPS